MSLEAALDRVSAERAATLTLDLVSIPSPTGETVEVTDRFAQELNSLGMEIGWFRQFPRTPVVIGRLRGEGDGPTLILNGHLDTVPVPHPAPERRDGRVYGRGSADMKGALAAAVEALRAAQEAGLRFRGDVILCAHGLHEAPGGRGEDLEAALRQGAIQGDAAIVLELGHGCLPLAQMGMGIFRTRFSRPGAATHELYTPPGTPHPILGAAEAVRELEAFRQRLAETEIPLLGCETVFVGQLHAGDFYNRFPTEALVEGTRRYAPEKTAGDAEAELAALLQPVAERLGLAVDVEFQRVRDGCRMSEDHPLVEALQSAYASETGRRLPITGSKVVADASLFEKSGGIPCLYHGVAGEGAHGDLESLPESELRRGARTYLRTVAGYVGTVG